MRHDHPMDRLHKHLDELVAAHDSIDTAAADHATRHHHRRQAEADRLAAEVAAARAGGAGHG